MALLLTIPEKFVQSITFRIFVLPVVDIMEQKKRTDCRGIALHVIYRFQVLHLGFYLLALLTKYYIKLR